MLVIGLSFPNEKVLFKKIQIRTKKLEKTCSFDNHYIANLYIELLRLIKPSHSFSTMGNF